MVEHRTKGTTQDTGMEEVAIIANMEPEHPAGGQWYIPVPGLDQARYTDSEQARRASERLCAIRGVPFTDPITVSEPFRD